MTTLAIQLKQVVVCVGERAILDAVDLEIRKGERVAIVGSNGAGKSTLLKVITGVMKPAHGEIEVLGRRFRQRLSGRELRTLRTEIGQVFQGLHLVQRLSVLENVLLGGLARNRSWLSWARIFPQAEIERAQAALQTVGLIGKAQVRADRLSGGERQKVAIARLLMQAPDVILADEPTAALDPLASADIATMLCNLARNQGSTLVTVVHDPGLLPLLADRVIGMRQGRILFDLTLNLVNDEVLAALYRDSNRPDTWIGRLEQTAMHAGVCQ